MGQNSTPLNKENFLQTYPKMHFNITKTCEHLGMSTTTFYRWTDPETGDPEFIESIRYAKQSKIDHVLSKQDLLIDGFEYELKREKLDKDGNVVNYKTTLYFPPNFSAIKLFLEAQARHLGYGMKPDNSNAEAYEDE